MNSVRSYIFIYSFPFLFFYEGLYLKDKEFNYAQIVKLLLLIFLSNKNNKTSQKEAVDNLTNHDKNSDDETEESKKEWEKAIERAKEAASKTTTPVPTIIGEGKQGKTINDVQTELGRTPTKTFGEIFDAYSIPKNEREILLKTYKTPESLERFLSNKYNGFLGTGG